MKLFIAASFGLLSGAAARSITVYNACPFTIWPAMFTGAGDRPNFPTGWEAPAWSNVTIEVPENWTSGRIWGRRDCDFSKPDVQSCISGACNGGLQCASVGGTGIPPATVAEWTLNSGGGDVKDWYDVSLVDGYNLPMRITNNQGCAVADCAVDLGPNCPSPLKGPFDSSGFPVGCKSACQANLDGNPGDSANCCTGSHNSAGTCQPSGVAYYDYFKGHCPNAYAYAFDEGSGTALWNCPSGNRAHYTLTFCP
ncbi:thaumatin-like protein [Pluteus cervinus]|uniref:Thaumatin-like protein n=1 Tax=Pluteus cervinus TaxID=181527 RepID=A0ACD3BAV1_9AGAR|nr:thaumatin-like protein [Pluteus cervinus]